MIYLDNIEHTIHKPALSGLEPVSTQKVCQLTAKLLHVKKPENVCLTAGGGQAVEGAIRAFAGEKSCVITTRFEQEDTYEILRKLGSRISYLEADAYFRPKYEELEALITPETKAIVCAHGCSATGNIIDLERICTIARRHSIPVIADGRLTAGAIDVNLEAIGAQVYCFTGEKMLMGPAGIGGICLQDGMDKEKLEPAAAPGQLELNAFAAALEFILEKGIYGISMLPHRLAKRFFESSKAMEGVTVYGDYGHGERLPVVAITARGYTPEEIKAYMQGCGILIGTEKNMARFSFGYFNTRPQVKETVQQLMNLLGIDEPYLLP